MIRLAILLLCTIPMASLGISIIMPEPTHKEWIESHRWNHRLIVISGDEQAVIKQRDLFLGLENDVLDRDLVVLTIIHPPTEDNMDPAIPDPESLAADLGINSSDFQVVLVGKDGRVKEHRFEQVEPCDFFRCIDAMPMRLQEMKVRNRS